MRSQPIRFTGMASGMDTDSIVRDLMRPQQYKIDNEKKEQALVKLRQDAWKDMNKKLYDFHTKVTDKMRKNSTFNKTNAASSNEDAISIKSDTVIPQGTHTFDVSQLAESASAVGRGEDGKGIAKGATLSGLMGAGEVPKKLAMRVNGKLIEVSVNSDDGLSGVAEVMNEKLKGSGFTASYDEANGSFFIRSTATGAEQAIDFDPEPVVGEDGKADFVKDPDSLALFKKIGIVKEDEDGKMKSEITGEDAVYSYNGGTGFTSSTNTIEVNGVQVTLKAANTGAVTISAEPDVDATYNFVKEFITEYNTLIDEINLKIGTRPGKDIMPLTAEERKDMSESDIELWEEKLNNSLFYKDSQLTNFVDSARSILGQVLKVDEGEHNSLASLGIITGSWEEKGKLYIQGDEDSAIDSEKPNRLREAIEANPQKVTDFFTKLGKELYENHNKTLTSSNKLKSAMNFYNDKVMNDEIKTFDKRISTLEDRMHKMEEMQYRKFAAMEQMLSRLNSQGDWLAQQFGGM